MRFVIVVSGLDRGEGCEELTARTQVDPKPRTIKVDPGKRSAQALCRCTGPIVRICPHTNVVFLEHD